LQSPPVPLINAVMLRAYGPDCDGSLIEATIAKIPDAATWVDLEEPTKEEEELVERCISMDVPTQSEMTEIEPSSRLYERGGALYMTVSVLFGVEEGNPRTTPISFVLADKRLITIRYATPKPIRAFAEHARRDPELIRDAPTALLRMLDAMIDRLADELEDVSGHIEDLSARIFRKGIDDRRIPAARLTALLTRIGRTQTLLAKIRYSAVSTIRMLGFVSSSHRLHQDEHRELRDQITSLSTDATSLTEHASYLSENVTFLLDASLGLISIEQNAAMKLFSWAALVFLPPTLIAGIYGMNFHHMPELNWIYGYPVALILIACSAVLPILYLKRRGWI
jgi:magnesium transporter